MSHKRAQSGSGWGGEQHDSAAAALLWSAQDDSKPVKGKPPHRTVGHLYPMSQYESVIKSHSYQL